MSQAHRLRNVSLALIALMLLGLIMAMFAGSFHRKVTPSKVPLLTLTGEDLVVMLQRLPATVPIPGTVQPTDETIIGARLLSAVTNIYVRAGDRTNKGDLLIELDDSGPRAIVKQREQAASSAQAALEEATNNKNRAVRLFESRNLSRADYDRALTNHRIALAEAERAAQAAAEARTQLGFTQITAPMNGTVVERYVEPGDTAMPGQALLKLFNPGRLRVEAILRESLIPYIVPGSELAAHIDALNTDVTSVVEEIVPSADPGSRTFTIKALLPPLPDLYPGMFARLNIPVGTSERLLVPRQAVQEAGQLRFVYLKNEDRHERRFVRLGETIDDQIEIVSGLAPGSIITLPE